MNKITYAIIFLCSFNLIRCNNDIVTVNARRLVTESLEGKDLEAKLQKMAIKTEKEIKSRNENLEKRVKELQNKAKTGLLDPNALGNEEDSIMREKRQIEQMVESAKQEYESMAKRGLANITGSIRGTMIDVAKKRGAKFIIVLDTGETIQVNEDDDCSINDATLRAHDAKFRAKQQPAPKVQEPKTLAGG